MQENFEVDLGHLDMLSGRVILLCWRCRDDGELVPGGAGGGGEGDEPAEHGHAAQHLCHDRRALHAAALARLHGAQERPGLPRPARHCRRERQPPRGASSTQMLSL